VVESLFRRIARGEKSAVPECIARHGGLVRSIALRLLGDDRAEVDDAVQEIFIDLWRSAPRFDPDRGTEEVFVAVIARRRLLDRRRRIGRSPNLEELSIDVPALAANLDAETRDEAERALLALAELPEDRRRVILLAVERGLTQEQIASELGIPLGTVKSQTRRTLQELRDRLTRADRRAEADPTRRAGR
jgi:RNA polymerase sigma-70 factor (ECF subfamily)